MDRKNANELPLLLFLALAVLAAGLIGATVIFMTFFMSLAGFP